MIRVSREVHGLIKNKQDDYETFSQTLKRLISPGRGLMGIAGMLSDEEGKLVEETIETTRDLHTRRDKKVEGFWDE